VGRTSAAQTDAKMTAEILTYSRSRGVFAGVSLDGATLRPDDEANKELYGTDNLSTKDITMAGKKVPDPARPLVSMLNKYSRVEK